MEHYSAIENQVSKSDNRKMQSWKSNIETLMFLILEQYSYMYMCDYKYRLEGNRKYVICDYL